MIYTLLGHTKYLYGSIGRMLVLSGCVWLAAQCVCLADETATGAASRKLQATLESQPTPVRPAGFEAPSQPPASEPPFDAGELEQSANEARGPHSTPSLAPDGQARIPFTPRHDSSPTAGEPAGDRTGALQSLVTVGSSLAVVLGLFLVVAWAMRRTVPGASAALPGEVVEVLGRSVLAGREQLHLVRCGSKLLLVSVSQSAGVSTLTEITEPDEVNRLAGLCRQSQPGSATAAFRQVFEQLARPRTAPAASVSETGDRTWEGYDA